MARTKAFDHGSVVDKAVQVFWSKGYEATSIQDLVDAMGINRGSIYDTFGDKSGLFLATIERYVQDSPARQLIAGATTADPRRAIEDFMHMLVDESCAPGGERGCFLTNTLTELCGTDAAMADHVKSSLTQIENALYTLIRRGQETGDIAPWRDARAIARSLLATAQGIMALAKVNPGRETLSDIAEVALDNLN